MLLKWAALLLFHLLAVIGAGEILTIYPKWDQDHDLHCIALRQLETALRLYCEREDYYSVITLAGASEEVFGSFLLKKLKDALREFLREEKINSAITSIDGLGEVIDKLLSRLKDNDKLCEEIKEKLRNDEEPSSLQDKLQRGRGKEKQLLKELEGIVVEKLEGFQEDSDEKNDDLINLLEKFKYLFNSHKPTLGSLTDAAFEIGNLLDGEPPSRRGVVGAANDVRNILKHGLLDETNIVEFDAPEKAKDMLDRAISNFFQLTGNRTQAMEQFEDMHVQDNAHIRPCSEDGEESSIPQ